MAKKMVRKGKRVLRKDKMSLSQLEEELGLSFVEPVVSRPFEKVKTNVFEKAPPGWKLKDSQKGWSQEEKKGSMEWEEGGRNAEIVDSQIEEYSTIETVGNKEDLQKWLRQGDNNTLKTNWKPTKEKDMKMKEAGKAAEGLAESKHSVK